MHKNVTPVYEFWVRVPDDQDNTNNTNEPKRVRYYIKKSDVSAIVSASHTYTNPRIPDDYIGAGVN